jgi:ABC-2 type transport system ATP-binding protein
MSLGYLPGDLRLYERLTAREHLRYFASLRGMRDIGDGESLAERLELELDRPVRSLSKGNRQKVGLVQALMHRPALAVFDEPTSGLDPLVQQVVYELVAEATADGRTVFVSSHVLSEVQHIADRVALIREGRLQLVDSVETLRQRALTRVEVTFASTPPEGAFDDVPGVNELERRGPVGRPAREGARTVRGARSRQSRGRPGGRLPRAVPETGGCSVASSRNRSATCVAALPAGRSVSRDTSR